MDELKSCPFCNSHAFVRLQVNDDHVDHLYKAICSYCLVCMPWTNDHDKAIALWNKRCG
jgi:Lar family restriction alleviation protein